MHKIVTVIAIALFFSCHPDPKLEEDPIFIPEEMDFSEEDKQTIENYLTENNLEATRTESGLYYIITEEGFGDMPTIESAVKMIYTGYFLDGETFDISPEDGDLFKNLLQLIPGFSEGVLLLDKGAKATFIIPSGLAYGNGGSGFVPPNTVVAFDVDLLDFL